MVHQCVSEDLWFRNIIGIDVGAPPLPEPETRLGFIRRYAEDSAKRLHALRARRDDWWEAEGGLLRRRAQPGLGDGAEDRPHGASPGQQTTLATDAEPRALQHVWPDADTGGLFQHRAPTGVYAYPDESAAASRAKRRAA